MNEEVTEQTENWEQVARAYEKVVIRNLLYEGMMDDLVQPLEGYDHIIDMGCGPGYLISKLLKLKTRKAVGVDFVEEMLQIARNEILDPDELKRTQLICAEVENVNLPEGTFDAVVSSNVLFNLKSPQPFLSNTYKFLKKGGRLVITSPHTKCNFNQLIADIRQDFKAQGNFEKNLQYIEIVEKVNRRFQGERSENEKAFMLFTNTEIERLLLETGFSKITYSDTTYAGHNFLVVADK